MVRKTHRGGIGAIGLANASFFHPSEQIRAKFPNTWKKEHLTNCTIICDGIQRVNQRDQHCYFVNVEGFDCVLHIVAKNSVLMWHQKLFLMMNVVKTKILLLLLMLMQSSFAACSRMLCQKLRHVQPLLHFVKKLMNSVVEGLRLTMTMSQLLKMLGPNHQHHPLDNGSFIPYAVIALNQKYLMQKESGKNSPRRKLER